MLAIRFFERFNFALEIKTTRLKIKQKRSNRFYVQNTRQKQYKLFFNDKRNMILVCWETANEMRWCTHSLNSRVTVDSISILVYVCCASMRMYVSVLYYIFIFCSLWSWQLMVNNLNAFQYIHEMWGVQMKTDDFRRIMHPKRTIQSNVTIKLAFCCSVEYWIIVIIDFCFCLQPDFIFTHL